MEYNSVFCNKGTDNTSHCYAWCSQEVPQTVRDLKSGVAWICSFDAEQNCRTSQYNKAGVQRDFM